jgi:hypothetical protein
LWKKNLESAGFKFFHCFEFATVPTTRPTPYSATSTPLSTYVPCYNNRLQASYSIFKMDSKEIALQKAIEDLNSGKIGSIRAAAKHYCVPRSTLLDRYHGTRTRRVAQQPSQRLTPNQEAFLADWIIEQYSQGFPPSHARVRDMAFRVLRMNGDASPLGKRWTDGFIARNPRVATCVGVTIDTKRIGRTQLEKMKPPFERHCYVCERHHIQEEDISNVDEPGMGQSQLRPFLDKRTKKRIVFDPNDQFATIETIGRAQGEVTQSTAREKNGTHTNMVQTGSAEAPSPVFESMQFSWQLNTE